MKKLIVLLLAFSAAILPVAAQVESEAPRYHFEVNAGAAMIPTVPLLTVLAGSVGEASHEYNKFTTMPLVNVEALFYLSSRWQLGINAGFCDIWHYYEDETPGTIVKENYVSIIPITALARFFYMNKPMVQLYGSFEAGAILAVDGITQSTYNVQLNPLGVIVGKNFFGFAELGLGFNYFGGKLGLGYRF